MEQHEPHRAAHGRVGTVARSERARARVEVGARRDLAVHDDERRHRMRRRVHPAQVQLGAAERADCGEDDGEHFGTAPRQHRVHGDRAAGNNAAPRLQDGERLVRITGRGREHRVDPFGRRRHDRQSVAPTVRGESARERLGLVVVDIDEPVGCVAHAAATSGPRLRRQC